MIELKGKEKVQVYPSNTVEKPLVSVLVQTYNHENYIQECLDGILMQEVDFDYEILLSEDDSSDTTREICITYANKYPDKIRLFLHDRSNNIKISEQPTGRYCFIWNFQLAKGAYIALCDGDDYWTDNLKLKKQVNFLEKNKNYNICFHNIKFFLQVEGHLRDNDRTRVVGETTDIRELSKGNFMHTASIVLRNNLSLPNWFLKVPIGDWVLYMIAIKDKKIMKFEKIMGVYRLHNESIWVLKSKKFRIRNTIKSYDFLIDSDGFIDEETKKKLKLNRKCFKFQLSFKKKIIELIKKYF